MRNDLEVLLWVLFLCSSHLLMVVTPGARKIAAHKNVTVVGGGKRYDDVEDGEDDDDVGVWMK